MNLENQLLSVENLTKRFNGRKKTLTVFENFSFQVRENEIVAFLGPSGCGKSTLLRCISGLSDFNGSISIAGNDPKVLLKKKQIGFSFQEPGLIEWRNVLQNVLLPFEIGAPTITKYDAETHAHELISLMGLSEFKEFYPSELSGGMKQRVALARALLLHPSLLLLDEPFNALDSLTKTKLTVEFEKILKQQQVTTVLITHNTHEAAYLADTIYLLSKMPAQIIKKIDVKYSCEKNIDLFDHPEFQKVVSECHKILFNL